ncbi:hypothetical protein FKV68_01745 [Sinorhizobium mexicanum]|uniref:Uncharacterized protein n=2 Tax=Sinorhizobium mexicanum TaxID=375549 RepID=A0A859R209_9HYPH|nr:hypothetical protein FKV68_01745 [Sinorhizobium mexicanum]
MAATVGIVGAAVGPVVASLIGADPAHRFSTDAVASGSGSGHSGGGGSGSGNSGSGRSGSSNSGDDSRGRGGGDDARGHGQDDGNNDRRAGNDDDDDRRRNRPDRPEVALNVSEDRLRGLLNGSLVAVDNLGRVLEVEVEFEHGARFVTVKPHGSDARRNPGAISSISIRAARTP